jgi:hypothetical protein
LGKYQGSGEALQNTDHHALLLMFL